LISENKFIFTTKDGKFGSQNQNIKYYPKVILEDSIFNFFNYAEVVLNDLSGIVPKYLFFIEGLEFNLKLGNIKDGFLESDYIWARHDIPQSVSSNSLTGYNTFRLYSKFVKYNTPKRKSWLNKSILDVVRDIASKEFALPSKKLFFSTSTSGINNYYQFNESNNIFLKKLSRIAYTQNYPYSPFFTFINCASEFYFMSLQEMLNQAPVNTYQLKETENKSLDLFAIQDITVAFLGEDINEGRYFKDFYYFSENGSITKESVKLEDFKQVIPKKNFLVLKSYMSTDINKEYIGLINYKKEKEFLLGKKNGDYRDNLIANRLEILVHFHPSNVAGKVINIEVKEGSFDKLLEINGPWLICKSSHYIDQDGVPFSKLELTNPGIQIDSSNLYKQEVL